MTPIFDFAQFADLVAERVLEKLGGEDCVLNTKEAGKLLNLHPDSVSELASRGQIPGRKLGRDWRFSRRALLKHLAHE